MPEDRVTISFDPATGKLEFSSPKELLSEASEAAQILIKTAHACLLPQDRHKASSLTTHADAEPKKEPKQEKPASRPARKPSESAGRSGRIGSFEKLDFNLTEDQERAIYEFYTSRRPAEQDEQVAVAMYIGEKVLKRESFGYNEIYTLLHLGGERELPKALDVVIGRMLKQNWVSKVERAYGLKFLARDYVEKLKAEVG